jgi:hypothetical protein
MHRRPRGLSSRAPLRPLARATASLLLVLGLGSSCTSLGDDLRRAEQAFSEARYEDVEEWLGDLEPSVGKMSTPLRARYYYLAGMSAFRIGQRAQARHALALCREELAMSAEKLPEAWTHNLESALVELDPPAAQ